MDDLIKKFVVLFGMVVTVVILAGDVASGNPEKFWGVNILALVVQSIALVIFFLDGTVQD